MTGRTVARRIAVGLVAAVGAGAAMGAVARLMMRLATLAAGHPASFSWGGTAGIVVVFTAAVVPGALLASLMRRRGRSALLVVGALLLCVPAAGVASTDLGSLEGLDAAAWVGVALSTAGVFLAALGLPFVTLWLIRAGDRVPRVRPTTMGAVSPGR